MRDWVHKEVVRQVRAYYADNRILPTKLAESCLRAGLRKGARCRWTQDEDSGAYDTACGHKFIVNEGTPAENEMQFCCYCGGALSHEPCRVNVVSSRTCERGTRSCVVQHGREKDGA